MAASLYRKSREKDCESKTEYVAEYFAHEVDSGRILCDYFNRNPAVVAPGGYQRGRQYAHNGLFLYGDFRYLCDRADTV
jgi:hypothetical protein